MRIYDTKQALYLKIRNLLSAIFKNMILTEGDMKVMHEAMLGLHSLV